MKPDRQETDIMAKRLARPTGTCIILEIPYGVERSTPYPLGPSTLRVINHMAELAGSVATGFL